jgi:hypothetical protein
VRGGAAAVPNTAGLYALTTDTVLDAQTQLTWQRAFVTGKTWLQALDACNTLADGGTPWRLPTVKELSTLVHEFLPSSVAIDTTAFPSTPAERFWSSTPSELSFGNPTAFAIDFTTGTYAVVVASNALDVRCVK